MECTAAEDAAAAEGAPAARQPEPAEEKSRSSPALDPERLVSFFAAVERDVKFVVSRDVFDRFWQQHGPAVTTVLALHAKKPHPVEA